MYVILSQNKFNEDGAKADSMVSRVIVADGAGATLICQSYINEHGLDEQKWSGGQVLEDGKKVGMVNVLGEYKDYN